MGNYTIENHIGTCPVCGEEMGHLNDHREGRFIEESYTCDNCRVIVVYHWMLPAPSRAELQKIGATDKQLDQAEQEERWARDLGSMTFELQIGHGWKGWEEEPD